MRSVRSELVRTLLVLLAPAGALAVFPYGALGFRASAGAAAPGMRMAFVKLSESECAAAMRTAKSAWRLENSTGRGGQAWLPLGELPEEPSGPVLERVPARYLSVAWPREAYAPPAWCPSAAAPAQAKLPVEPVERPLAFSREELLTIP